MAKLPKIVALFALAVCACGEGASTLTAPLDRFTYPTALALHTLGDGRRALVVVSSNFDLSYDAQEGGSVLVVDPDASAGDTLSVISGLRIASFGASAAIVSGRGDAGAALPATCPGWTAPDEVLVTSRTANALFRLTLADDGTLTCGDGCEVKFPNDLVDPYGVVPACRTDGGATSMAAYVTHLGSQTGEGWLTLLDLSSRTSEARRLPFSSGATQDITWDPARRRLYVTGRFTTVGYAPLRWLDVAFPTVVFGSTDLNAYLRGADLRGIALAAPDPATQFRTRAYIATRVFDLDLASTYGGRTQDVGGALIVMDVSDDAAGRPRAQVVRIVPVGIGASRVEVLPGRPAGQELVVVTSNEGSIAIYDASRQSVVRVLAIASADTVAAGPFQPRPEEDPAASPGERDAVAYHAGEKLFGSQPFAMASDLMTDGRIRLFVGSFDRGFITEVLVDPALPAAAQVTKRFGRRQP